MCEWTREGTIAFRRARAPSDMLADECVRKASTSGSTIAPGDGSGGDEVSGAVSDVGNHVGDMLVMGGGHLGQRIIRSLATQHPQSQVYALDDTLDEMTVPLPLLHRCWPVAVCLWQILCDINHVDPPPPPILSTSIDYL